MTRQPRIPNLAENGGDSAGCVVIRARNYYTHSRSVHDQSSAGGRRSHAGPDHLSPLRRGAHDLQPRLPLTSIRGQGRTSIRSCSPFRYRRVRTTARDLHPDQSSCKGADVVPSLNSGPDGDGTANLLTPGSSRRGLALRRGFDPRLLLGRLGAAWGVFMRSRAARSAHRFHSPKVAGSNPASAIQASAACAKRGRCKLTTDVSCQHDGRIAGAADECGVASAVGRPLQARSAASRTSAAGRTPARCLLTRIETEVQHGLETLVRRYVKPIFQAAPRDGRCLAFVASLKRDQLRSLRRP